MSNIILIKRSDKVDAPTSLQYGELAYSEKSGKFFFGTKAGAVIEIGGKSIVDKLATIEEHATADQTGAEIKALYEKETNTNAFTDDLKAKLTAIEAGAKADQTGAEIKALYEKETNTNAFTDAEKTKLSALDGSHFKGAFTSLTALTAAITKPVAGDYAHVDAGAGHEVQVHIWDETDKKWFAQAGSSTSDTSASIKTKYEANADTNVFTDADKAKLAAIEAHATADQTGAQIKALYEKEANTNAYSDADKAKLAAIEAGAKADQTGAEIKALYEKETNTNAFTDALKAKLDGIEAGAKADLTGAEILALIGHEHNSKLVTDTEKAAVTKLAAGTTGLDGGTF